MQQLTWLQDKMRLLWNPSFFLDTIPQTMCSLKYKCETVYNNIAWVASVM